MIIKASASLRNEYSSIAELARSTGEPIYITKNGEGDGVFMDIASFEQREKRLAEREEKLRRAEEQLVERMAALGNK